MPTKKAVLRPKRNPSLAPTRGPPQANRLTPLSPPPERAAWAGVCTGGIRAPVAGSRHPLDGRGDHGSPGPRQARPVHVSVRGEPLHGICEGLLKRPEADAQRPLGLGRVESRVRPLAAQRAEALP